MLHMLTFCTWKDEDGHHYGVTNQDPHKYFKWRNWRACSPKTCEVDAKLLTRVVSVREGANGQSFIPVIIEDWDTYFDDIMPKLRYLR